MSQKWCYRCQTYYETDAAVCPQCGADLMNHHPMSPEGKQETAQRLASSRAHTRDDGILAHPGRQLITVSKIIFWTIFIVFILLSVILIVSMSTDGYSVPGILLGAVVAGVGYIIAWINSIKMRAFGALVDDVETIKASLRKEHNNRPRRTEGG